jgi:hypothetical protein
MDDFHVYAYVTTYECILCVVRHCEWQYCVCDDEFDTCYNNMFYCFVTRGGQQNW